MRNLVIDCHCDTIMRQYLHPYTMLDYKYHVTKKRLKRGKVNLQVFAIFLPAPVERTPVEPAIDMISLIYKMVDEDKDFVLIKSKNDLDALRNSKKIGAIIAFEGAEPLVNHLRFLPVYYKLGLRLITITWSRRNYFADGCKFNTEDETNYGLTALGKRLIKKMNEMGIVIDVSHINRQGFYDIINLTQKPIVASHSCVKNLADSPRNLSDDQIKKIADTEGVIGVNFYPRFLTGTKEASISDVINHIDYICQLLGNANHVGIGSDFDGIQIVPKGLENPSKIKNIAQLLNEKGYDKQAIDKIMGENFARVFAQVWQENENL